MQSDCIRLDGLLCAFRMPFSGVMIGIMRVQFSVEESVKHVPANRNLD